MCFRWKRYHKLMSKGVATDTRARLPRRRRRTKTRDVADQAMTRAPLSRETVHKPRRRERKRGGLAGVASSTRTRLCLGQARGSMLHWPLLLVTPWRPRKIPTGGRKSGGARRFFLWFCVAFERERCSALAPFPCQEEVRNRCLPCRSFDCLWYPSPRNQMRALRSRLPRSATGDIPPPSSPTLLRGDERSVPSSQEETPAGARIQPPSIVRARAGVDAAGDVGQGRDRQSSDDRPGASNGGRPARRLATPEAAVSPVIVHEASGQAADGKQQLGGTLLENNERAGVERGHQNLATVRDDVAVVAERVPAGRAGGKSTSETTSTASRPSELFDSLDLSAS